MKKGFPYSKKRLKSFAKHKSGALFLLTPWLLAIVVSLMLSSCVVPRLIERPKISQDSQELASRLYRQIWEQNQKIETVVATARIRIHRGIFSRAIRQALLLKKPDSLRIDSFTMFGNLLHRLVLYQGRLQILDLESGRISDSESVNRLLREEVGLDLSGEDVVAILAGGFPLELREDYLGVNQKRGNILRGFDSQVLVNHETGLPIRYMAHTDNGSIYEVDFDDYRDVSGILFPHRISIAMQKPRLSFEIVYEDVSLNRDVGEGKFRGVIYSRDEL